jgi:hypothetical protein
MSSLKKERDTYFICLATASHDRTKQKRTNIGIKKKVGNEGNVLVTKGQPVPKLLRARRRWNAWFRGLFGLQRS